MSLNKNQLFLIIVFSAFLCSLALSKEPKTYKCDLRNRPKPEECIDQPVSATCGYYTKNCPFEICGSQTYNGCAACSDPNVLYYTKEDCKPEELVQICNKDICQGLPDEEKKVYEPVCGIRKDYRNKVQTQTFDNYCKACQNSKYPWYQAGVCKDDRKYCDARRPTVCNAQYKPVCAHFTLSDFGSVYTTASNSCEACSDRSVDYYTDGECGEARNEQTYCLPNNRPDICTLEYNPVCGFYQQKDGSIAHKVVGNACSACADPTILYHIPGPCVFKCNRDPNIIFDCAGVYEPVCGKYTQRGKTYSVSLRNSCIGCYYSGKPIETYTDGLCPGDKGIRCENDAGAFLEGILFPVCGYEKEKCNSDSCRETYAEPILACTNTDTIWYSAGTCPGDKGVPCDDYRKKSSDFGFVYENVCGFSARGKRNYKDQYDACENSYVQYFTKGPC